MTATEKDLLALEKQFWTGDKEFYRGNVDDSCLVAFGPEMAGVMSNKDIAATAKERQSLEGSGYQAQGPDRTGRRRRDPQLRSQCHPRQWRALRRTGQHRLCQAGQRLEDGVPPADTAVTARRQSRTRDAARKLHRLLVDATGTEGSLRTSPTSASRRSVNAASPSSAFSSSFSYLRRGTSSAPKRLRCSVVNCVSSRTKRAFAEPLDQVHQADLRGVALARKHAFAEEGAAERHAVEPAGEPAVAPGFDRVAVAAPVELDIGFADRRIDPGVAAIVAGFGAAVDDAFEIGVERHLEAVLPDQSWPGFSGRGKRRAE